MAIESKKPNAYVLCSVGASIELRETPSQDGSVIRKLPSGEGVTLQGETKDHWCYVQIGTDLGYVMSKELSELPPETTNAPDDSSASTSSKPSISVKPAIDRMLAQAAPYAFFDDANDRNGQKIAVLANENITDIRYYHVLVTFSAHGKIICTGCEELYKQERMENGTLLVMNMAFPELLPDRAIAFTDGNGMRQVYYFLESGENGTPMVRTFDAIEIDVDM